MLIHFLFLQDGYVIHIDHEEEDYGAENQDLGSAEQPDKPQPEPYIQLASGSYACNYCRKVFPSKYKTIRHLRIHTGEKPFQCFYCESKCSQKSDLFRHCKLKHGMTKEHFESMATAANMNG